MTLSQRFTNLKKKVGGNRELMHYEETFGQPMEENHHITMPARHIVRILSETEYAIHLSVSLDGKYDREVDACLSLLENAMENDGTITKDTAAKAEEKLLPAAKDAKSYSLILAGHSHIDMNWMWSWTETVASTVATFTTMLKIMEEYPTFCFSQSQTSVYKIIDDYAPELHDKIKQRIDEGRWEVTASQWVESDENMPGTESLLREISCTRDYLSDQWGIPADKLEIDFSPDSFGHSANMGEIHNFGGVRYMYHCRGLDNAPALYRWRSQSGKDILVYREQKWYNSAITPSIAMSVFDISKRSGGLKTGLVVYGVGDHGGGPTRRDVNRALEMMEWPIFPALRFGTFREYFKLAESVRDKVTLVDHELNFNHTGCYTTQSRIKCGNKRSEAALSEAENAMTIANLQLGTPFRREALDSAWQKVLFTHFHDILTGSCVQDTREHAMGLFQDALATANTEITLSLGKLSAAIDTSSVEAEIDPDTQSFGAGVGFGISSFAGRPASENGCGTVRIWNLFNNTYVDKEEPVEITCWDWTGDMRRITVKDTNGQELPCQLLDKETQKYWDHQYFRILVYVKIPALSYTTVVLSEKEVEEYPFYFNEAYNRLPDVDPVLDNGIIRVVIDRRTGAVVSLQDRKNGTEYVAAGEKATLYVVNTDTHNSSGWYVGSHFSSEPVTDLTAFRTSTGALRQSVSFDANIRSSRVTVTYQLDKNADAVTVKIKADWSEVRGTTVPVLSYVLPLSYNTDAFRYNIPAGSIIRPATDEERPGLSYVAALWDKGLCAGITADSKYGYRALCKDGHAVLESTLLNTSDFPDPYPERGIHEITLHLGLFENDAAAMEKKALSYNRPVTPISTGSHKGTLPPTGSFMQYDAPGAVITAMWPEDGKLCVRMLSLSDKPTTVSLCRDGARSAEVVDMSGNTIGSATVKNGKITTVIAPKCLVCVKISF